MSEDRLEVEEWQWDESNIAHLARHRISPRQVVEVAQLDDPRFREDHDEEHPATFHMIGMDATGKMLLICLLEVNDGVWRAITGWEVNGEDDLEWYRRNR